MPISLAMIFWGAVIVGCVVALYITVLFKVALIMGAMDAPPWWITVCFFIGIIQAATACFLLRITEYVYNTWKDRKTLSLL